MPIRIAIINCGSDDQEVLTEGGKECNASELLCLKSGRMMESAGADASFRIYRPPEKRDDFPALPEFDAVIIPGSKHDIDENEVRSNAWMGGLLAFIRGAAAASKPMLGICFGHQAMGVAFGSKISRIAPPANLELGLTPACLTEAGKRDPIFDGVPERFDAMQFHFCFLREAPPEGIVLAKAGDMIEAIRIGESAWGVQFHPDYSGANVEQMIARHKGMLTGKTDLSKVRLHGERSDSLVLSNFLKHVRYKFRG